MIFFVIALLISYIIFWNSFVIPKIKHRFITIIIGSFVLVSYLSTWYLYDLTKQQGQLLLNPLFVSLNDIISSVKNSFLSSDTNITKDNNPLEYTNIPGQNKQPNIILMFAESFSPEYSLHNGGLYDRMPQTDQIQKEGITFSNYMAPGCVSEHAHTSLLQWIIPISYGDLFLQDGYTAFSAQHDTLPEFFNKSNYSTNFISTASLEFLQQRKYLEKIGYQNIIGEEAFTDKPKRTFDAASDGELYNKTEEFINSYNQQKPFFLTLQTISSHQPRHSPYGDTVEATFKYTDEQLGKFYSYLKSQWFFENGLLIIISDHRIRGKPQQNIIDKLWPKRPSHVMATIVGTGIKPNTINNNMYQAIDFHFWIKQLISSGTVPFLSFINNPLDSKSTINRDRGIYSCKYIDNTIWTIQNNTMTDYKQSSQEIKDLVEHYQHKQFNDNILQLSWDSLSGKQGFTNRKDKNFLLLGHGWAPQFAPNNSLSGFITAIKQWADGVELDISYTADGINIVRHGPHGHEPSDKIENSCYGRTYIPETTYYTLRKECTLPNGEKIMTFDEFLNLTKDFIPVYMVEIKVYNKTKAVEQFREAFKTAKKYNLLDRIIWVSYDPTVKKIITVQKNTWKAWDMYTIDDFPSPAYSNFDFIMIGFSKLKNKQNLEKIKSTQKGIITYTPVKIEDIAFSYNLWLSGLLVDNIPIAKEIINNIEKEKALN